MEPDPCNGLSTLSGDDARRDAVLDSVELQRALLEALIRHAAEHGFSAVRVRAPPAAGRFYEACGFLPAVLRSATHMRPL